MHAQREWASSFSLVHHMIINIQKKQFSGVSSPGLKWGNKTYIQAKLKGLLTKKSSLSCCNSAESSVLKTIMQQTGKLIQAKTDSTNLSFYPSTIIFYPASILSVIRTRTRYNAISKILDLFSFKGGWKRLGPTQLGNDNVIHRPLDITFVLGFYLFVSQLTSPRTTVTWAFDDHWQNFPSRCVVRKYILRYS